MSASPPLILPIFSTPFGIAPIAPAQELNPALGELFRTRRGADPAARAGSLVYISRDDLFDWPEETAQRLRTELLRAVVLVVNAVNTFEQSQLNSFRVESRGWFTIVAQNGRVPAAIQPLTAWCALYCVAAPGPSARPDGGVLRLYESRLGTMFQDATNSVMQLPFTHGHYTWRPVPGSVAVFPASLTHEITLVRSPGELVLVTARVRFVAPGQEGVGRW